MRLLYCDKYSRPGFTLAELLIALVILGVIATFTIPKVLVTQQNQRSVAIAKEDMAALSGAYQMMQQQGTLSAATVPADLFAYINYVRVDSTTVVDNDPASGGGTEQCGNPYACIRMHNGSIIVADGANFGGTATNNAIYWDIDPDGGVNGQLSVEPELHYGGRITTHAPDPTWFSWN